MKLSSFATEIFNIKRKITFHFSPQKLINLPQKTATIITIFSLNKLLIKTYSIQVKLYT